jgi:hypothetical protein
VGPVLAEDLAEEFGFDDSRLYAASHHHVLRPAQKLPARKSPAQK